MKDTDMPYEYLNDLPTSDIALRVWGETFEETLIAAAEATTTAMVGEIEVVTELERLSFELREASREALFVALLRKLVRYKDEESLIVRVHRVSMRQDENDFVLRVQAEGQSFDRDFMPPAADIANIPLGRFELVEAAEGWGATLVLEV